MNGIRTSKTVGGVKTEYLTAGGRVLSEKKGSTWQHYLYDAGGQLQAIRYKGADYYYVRDGLMNIIGLVDTSGNTVVSYAYDSWGVMLGTSGSMAETLGKDNPYRYKGYYYDDETRLYYLGSRYYDPAICRFINADSQINPGILGINLYAYCGNNPVNMVDYTGHSASTIGIIGGLIIAGLAAIGGWIASTSRSSGKNTEGTLTKIIANTVQTVISNVTKPVINDKIVEAAKEKEKTVAVDISIKKGNQAYFPANPYDFNPKGLIRTIRVQPGKGKNGGIIHWHPLGVGHPIFEWDEDFRYGSHYHIMESGWGGKHLNGIHYRPGMPVPEPWNTLYFGN